MLLVSILLFGLKSKARNFHENLDNVSIEKRNRIVPFFYIPPSSSKQSGIPEQDLHRSLERYKDDVDKMISALILSRDIAIKTEWDVYLDDVAQSKIDNLLSLKLEERIKETAQILERDYLFLQNVLKPIPFTLSLPFKESDWYEIWSEPDKTSAYDSAMQIITHIVRDWSKEGRASRESLYNWSIQQLLKYRSFDDGPVLVPGAGLGRLAHDISETGYIVEANELSLCMSVVAHKFLHNEIEKGVVHPFSLDFFINEVKTVDRYQAVAYPDLENDFIEHLVSQKKSPMGYLSYTVGDFTEIYSQPVVRSSFAAVVTCFFIDTATNIFEYLLVIRNSLNLGGVWINVGPLQWHSNAVLHPSGDELRLIIQSLGFSVLSWSVDKEAINYRHDDTKEDTRYTKFEGYKPLRFVVKLMSEVDSLKMENVAEQISRIRFRRYANQTNFRPHARNQEWQDDHRTNVTITEIS